MGYLTKFLCIAARTVQCMSDYNESFVDGVWGVVELKRRLSGSIEWSIRGQLTKRIT